MAFDKVVDSQALDGALGAVADAIRGKTGSAAPMTLEQMPGEISNIQTGGVELPALSNPGAANDLMAGKQLLDGEGRIVEGAFSITEEITEQDTLIAQIQAALVGKVVGTMPEDLSAVLAEQESAIAELKNILKGKATGGGGNGDAVKYAKFLATPDATTSFTITNPLGGVAAMISVRRTVDTVTANRKIQKYAVCCDLGLGAIEAVYDGGKVRYAAVRVESGIGNGEFVVSDGAIELRQYNSATTWDTANEYEVEIYQREEAAE